MTHSAAPELSLLVPAYNEAASLPGLCESLFGIMKDIRLDDFEILICDDGSSDNTVELVSEWHEKDPRIKLIRLSRNFGKEYAMTALLATAQGKAMLTLDADGQHPVELIPEFLKAWHYGAQVVIGVSKQKEREGVFKRLGTRMFYKLFNSGGGQYLEPGSTDFRLITRDVQQAFLRLPEHDRMTRSLIDWLGFERVYIPFETKPRENGTATYSTRKLLTLAANSFVSMSAKPLYIFGYLGIFITFAAGLLGFVVLIEQVILEDPLGWDFTGTAMLGILILFLVGILLLSQSLLSLYVTSIQRQSKQRPLYVIDYGRSAGIKHED